MILIKNLKVDKCLLFLYNQFNQNGLVLSFILKGDIIIWINCIQE